MTVAIANGDPGGMMSLACYARHVTCMIIDALYNSCPSFPPHTYACTCTCTHMHIHTCTCSLRAALSAKPNDAESLHTLGMTHFDLENYRKAKEMFKNVLKLTPMRTESLYGLARTLVKLGDRRAAAMKLKDLLKIDKGNDQARELLESLEKH